MSTATRTLTVIVVIIWIAGCGSPSLRQGRSYLANDQYAQAIEALTDALNRDPANAKIHRDLGIAYYKNWQYEQALNELKKAKQVLSKDSLVVFYLGLLYERSEQYDKAIEEYSNYTKLRRYSRLRGQIERRIQLLARQQATQWAKERMSIEKEIDVASIPDNSVAVTYFRPLGVSENLEPLHKGLADLLIVDLSIVESLRVIERNRLTEIYGELGLSSTDIVDQNTAPRMGKLLGASSIVTGAFTGLGSEQWRIDPALGFVKAGDFRSLEGVAGELAGFLRTEKELALKILEELNIKVTEAEREKILKNVPTESLAAFLAYSRGLDYADKRMYSQAAMEFREAISLDPGFDQARIHLTEVTSLSQPVESIDELEILWASEIPAEEEKNGLIAATIESVSQGDVSAAPVSEPEFFEREPEVEVQVILRWGAGE